MGYDTYFQHTLYFNKPLPPKALNKFKELEKFWDEPWNKPGRIQFNSEQPDGICKWWLTDNQDGLTAERSERFRNPIEWLEWIIKYILIPSGLELDGVVKYRGEDFDDNEIIIVKANQVRVESFLFMEVLELKAFQQFVLNSPDRRTILENWSLYKKTLPELSEPK